MATDLVGRDVTRVGLSRRFNCQELAFLNYVKSHLLTVERTPIHFPTKCLFTFDQTSSEILDSNVSER